MKLFSFPFDSLDFYCKPDTALAKPTDDFYLPPVCAGVSFAVCYAIKINRLGRHIEPRFAHRYYSETNVGVCLYGHPAQTGEATYSFPWLPGTVLDYSLSMPRTFMEKGQPECITLALDNSPERVFQLPNAQRLEEALAYVSQFVYLKMGDMVLLELHKPIPISPGNHLVINHGLLDFYIK